MKTKKATMPDVTDRVELVVPTDRTIGTISEVMPGGIFVVKYDNGDYVAYQPNEVANFVPALDRPIPRHAANFIVALRQALGRTPPETGPVKLPLPRDEPPPIEEE